MSANKQQNTAHLFWAALFGFMLSMAPMVTQADTPQELASQVAADVETKDGIAGVDGKTLAERARSLGQAPENVDPNIVPDEFFSGPGEQDISFLMLKQIFGSPVETVRKRFFTGATDAGNATESGGQITLITALSGLMFAVSLVFGSILLAYIFIVGLLKTNQTGNFLGNWDSMFLPVRAFGGLAFSFPLPGFGGLTGIQVITLAIALLGISVGSAVFAFSVKVMPAASLVSYQPVDKFSEITQTALVTTACAAAKARSYNGSQYTAVLETPSVRDGWFEKMLSKFRSAKDAIWRETTLELALVVDAGTANQKTVATCGRFVAPTRAYAIATNSAAFQNAYDELKKSFETSAERTTEVLPEDRLEDALQALQIFTLVNATNKLIDSNVISDIVEGGSKITDQTRDNYATVTKEIMTSYQLQTAATVPAYAEEVAENAVSNMLALGWAGAGSFYWHIERAQDKIFGDMDLKIHESLSFEDDAAEAATDAEQPEVRAAIQRAIDFSESARSPAEEMEAVRKSGEGWWGSAGSAINNAIAKFMISGGRYLSKEHRVGFFGTVNTNTNINPMLEMRTLGNTLVNTALAIGDTSGIEKLKGSNNKKGGDGEGFVGWLTGSIMGFAFLIGIVLAYVIPSMPYFMWIIAMGGYMIYIVQAVLAAPLWAIMHMHPEGGEITGKGGSGYPILANLFMRPTLMVVGLFCGMALVRVMGWLVNETLFETINMVRAGSFIGPLTALFMIAAYTVLMFIVSLRSFALIAELPRAVLRWMGVTDQEDLGERETSDRTMAIFSRAGSANPVKAKK